MGTTIIKYKKPREILGEYLDTNYRDKGWTVNYNDQQKEFWYMEADKLLDKLKQWNIR